MERVGRGQGRVRGDVDPSESDSRLVTDDLVKPEMEWRY